MFTLQSRPNPLDALIANAGAGIMQRSQEDQQMQKRNQEMQKIFSKINENSSPLEILQTIDGVRDPEEKKYLFSAFQKINEQKQEHERQKSKDQKEEQKEKRKENEENSKKQEELQKEKRKENEENSKKQEELQLRNEIEEGLIASGVPPQTAKLYTRVGAGSQTEMLKNIHENIARGNLPNIFAEQGQFNQAQKNPLNNLNENGNEAVGEAENMPENDFEAIENEELANDLSKNKSKEKWPTLPQERGLKPAETFQRENSREKINTPLYQVVIADYAAKESEGLAISRLQQLNPLLPDKGFVDLFNIDLGTGEIKIPSGATQEQQLFAKVVNDFTTKAKDSYGARVTNFELDRFLKRLPTLANSREGRELILAQIEILNDIDKLESGTLRDVYNHYGIQKINSQQAQQIADQRSKKEKEKLLKRYETLDGRLNKEDVIEENRTIADLPPIPKGKARIQDPNTGDFWNVTPEQAKEAEIAGWKIIK